MVVISGGAGIGANVNGGLDISRNGVSGNIGGGINGGAGFNIGRSNPNQNTGIDPNVNIRYGNNEPVILPPSQNSYRPINPPAYQSPYNTVNYPSVDSWNHSTRGDQPNYNYISANTYTNTNSDPSVYIIQEGQPDKPYIDNKAGNNEKVWNAALATLNSLANISSKGTGTPHAIEDLAHSSRTLIDSLKESGALSSFPQVQRGSPACNSHTHSHIPPSNCSSPNTNAAPRLTISPNGNQLSINGSNHLNNGGLTLVSDNNSYRERPAYYDQSSSTSNYNDIQISQGNNGSVIINLPSNYNDTQTVTRNPYDYLNANNSHTAWPLNLDPNSTVIISI
jgi:hypothetical protein